MRATAVIPALDAALFGLAIVNGVLHPVSIFHQLVHIAPSTPIQKMSRCSGMRATESIPGVEISIVSNATYYTY